MAESEIRLRVTILEYSLEKRMEFFGNLQVILCVYGSCLLSRLLRPLFFNHHQWSFSRFYSKRVYRSKSLHFTRENPMAPLMNPRVKNEEVCYGSKPTTFIHTRTHTHTQQSRTIQINVLKIRPSRV